MRQVSHPLPSGEVSHSLPSGETRGFSLLEVLIVVTIISAIATIAIPNLLRAIDRGRQSSTLADMRTLGSALERYAVDHLSYPTVDDALALRPELEPDYVKQLPVRDGWGHPFVFEVDDQGASYTLRSPGKDGAQQETKWVELTDDFAADIVLVDGVFVQRPAGTRDKADSDAENGETAAGDAAAGNADSQP